MIRQLHELVSERDSAWPLVVEWVAKSDRNVEVLQAERSTGEAALLSAQVTTRSPMGAIAYNCAAIFVDNGWLRILGAGGHSRINRSIATWNEGRSNGFYFVADDVLGGFFAINGGAFDVEPGHVVYFAPDSLAWENLGVSYSDFINWTLSPDLTQFYESFYWPSWQNEVAEMTGDECLGVYPFLFAEGPGIGERSRRRLPVSEQWSFQLDALSQMGGE